MLAAAAVTGIFSALLADTLKVITEHYEHSFFQHLEEQKYLIFFLPFIGFTTIHFLRFFMFRSKPNKGMKEVFDAIKKNGKSLPAYKIPSHYINGFLTVIFGGSTGIEVSTVVATASVGALSSRKVGFLTRHQTDLICAGLAAGVTALFNAPIAGYMFAFEVFTKSKKKTHLGAVTVAILSSYLLTHFFFYKQVFDFQIETWHTKAIPYFMLLGVLAGLSSVFLTKSVLYVKKLFASFQNDYVKIVLGSLVVSSLVYFFPGLYGEGYFAINHLTEMGKPADLYFYVPLLALLLLKPVATSVTLGAGGDGGVFAPSLFIGAFLGFIVAVVLNHFFDLGLIPLNFMVIGMAAVLSGSIHAPLTAIFLVCAIAGNYVLFFPIVLGAVISLFVARYLYPFNVYTYKPA